MKSHAKEIKLPDMMKKPMPMKKSSMPVMKGKAKGKGK